MDKVTIKVPIWYGDNKKLPEKGKLFFHKGSLYSWDDCRCGCGYPLVLNENGSMNHKMTVLFRGDDQGDTFFNLLLKAGLDINELAKWDTENKQEEGAIQFLTKLDKDHSGNIVAFLESKGINPAEFYAVLKMNLLSRISDTIATILN